MCFLLNTKETRTKSVLRLILAIRNHGVLMVLNLELKFQLMVIIGETATLNALEQVRHLNITLA